MPRRQAQHRKKTPCRGFLVMPPPLRRRPLRTKEETSRRRLSSYMDGGLTAGMYARANSCKRLSRVSQLPVRLQHNAWSRQQDCTELVPAKYTRSPGAKAMRDGDCYGTVHSTLRTRETSVTTGLSSGGGFNCLNIYIYRSESIGRGPCRDWCGLARSKRVREAAPRRLGSRAAWSEAAHARPLGVR